jgi:hypothetical protein
VTPCGPVAPTSPRGIVKFKLAAALVPPLLTAAVDPGLPVLTVPTATVAAVPVAPIAPVAPVDPVAPVAPVGPVDPVGPENPASDTGEGMSDPPKLKIKLVPSRRTPPGAILVMPVAGWPG